MESLMLYLLFGTIWSMMFEFGGINPKETTNGTRIRQILLWPIPFGAFVIGFLVAFWNSMKNQ